MKRWLIVFAALALFMALSAESCQKSVANLSKAGQGLDALSATCADLQDSAAADAFAAAEADQANLPGQSVSDTKQKALDAMHKRCDASTNASYQPYVDVQTDITQ